MLKSVHFVPADRERLLAKIPSLEADRIVLELEDGVGPAQKDEARENAREWLRAQGAEGSWVRINAIETEEGRADCEMLRSLPTVPLIVLPKVEEVEAVQA